MNPKILVGCPTYDGKGYCLKQYVEAVKKLDYDNYDIMLVDNSETAEYYEKLKSLGINAWHLGEKGLSVREKIAACRNLLRKIAIEKYDYFLILEQDVIPPKDIIKKLLSHNKKIVSAVYNMRMDDGKDMPVLWKFLDENEISEMTKKNLSLKSELENVKQKNANFCRRFEEGELPKDKLIRIAACGLGAVIIHKDVLERVAFKSEMGKEAYDDMLFSRDALSKGFEIFADTGIVCGHLQDESFMKSR